MAKKQSAASAPAAAAADYLEIHYHGYTYVYRAGVGFAGDEAGVARWLEAEGYPLAGKAATCEQVAAHLAEILPSARCVLGEDGVFSAPVTVPDAIPAVEPVALVTDDVAERVAAEAARKQIGLDGIPE